MRVCLELECPELTTKTRCKIHTREHERARGTTTERGYGSTHRRLSKTSRARAIGKPCCLCGKPMLAGQPLALDHTPDRQGYRGVAHLSCNSSEGATRGATYR